VRVYLNERVWLPGAAIDRGSDFSPTIDDLRTLLDATTALQARVEDAMAKIEEYVRDAFDGNMVAPQALDAISEIARATLARKDS